MFTICSALCFCCLSGAEIERPPGETLDPRFIVHAKVLEALEGGPLAILVTLEYRGEKDIEITTDPWFNNSYVVPRAEWEFRPVVGGAICGRRYGSRKLSPGDQWSEVHYLHHHFDGVTVSKVVLDVSWRVYEPGETGKAIAPPSAKAREQAALDAIRAQRGNEIACPATKLVIEIPPATKERLRALCQRLQEKLGRNQVTEEKREKNLHEVIDYLRYTNHAELAPVVWRLIESFPDPSPLHHFIPMVYAAAEDKGAVNRRLVKLARDPNYPELGNIFWYWRRERVTLSPEEMAPLLQSENVWTRVLTSATFTDRCGKEWTDQLFRDLRASQQPLPGERFARLLSQLDDDDFAIRERATRALQQHGEPVRAQLLKALQGKPTPEVKSRVQRVLDEIAKGPPPIVRTTLWQLGNADHPQSQAMLKLLAEGPTDSWATTEAKTILAKREGQKRE